MVQRILIIFLLTTSLIPSMFLKGSNFRYLPAFIIVFISGMYALFSLKESKNLNHLKTYYRGNKNILLVVFLYVLMIWVSSFKTGIKENLVLISGITSVLIIMHLLFPLLIQTRKDFVFIIKTLFCVCILNAIIAVSILLINKYENIHYGIYKIGVPLSSKLEALPGIKITVLQGIFSNPNSLGILMAFIFPAILFLIQETKSLLYRFLLIVCVLLMSFTLLHSFSRASIFSTIIVLLFFLLFYFSKGFFTVAKVIMISITLLFNLLIASGIDLNFLKNQKIIHTGRFDLWDRAIEIIQGNMLFGIGYSNTFRVLPLGYSSHNTFIEIALGSGILAMILYSIYLLLLILKIRLDKDPELSIYVLLSLLSFSVLQIFETLLFGGMSIANFYFLIVMISYLSITSSHAT